MIPSAPCPGAALRPPTAARRLALLVLALVLSGCTLLQLRDEAAEVERSTVLAGRVECPADPAQPLVVAAVVLDGDAPAGVAHQVWLHACGGFELLVPEGHHQVVAFADRNGNGHFDDGEPLVELGPVSARGTGVVLLEQPLLLPSAAGDADRARRLGLHRLAPLTHSTQAGAVLDASAPLLAADQGALGYWAPMSYFRRYGGNVYAFEPYDPQRVPVLFVHGAAGTPADLRPLIERLDRSRYQAWVYAYPSGASVDSMAHLLYWKLLNLQLRHRFGSWAVVAHSMGGLVVRSTLASLAGELPPPRLFITLSTPWGGEATAELGVRHSPAVVPSWHDMRPQGPFMAALFRRPLPQGTEHALLFGHRGGPSLLGPNTDGTVTLASQLRPEAQAAARRVVGFDEDHMSILAAEPVARMVASLLDAAMSTAAAPQGQLRLTLDAADGARVLDRLPSLRLRPVDGQGAALTLVLGPDDAQRPLGPLPPGRYDAGLLAPGYGAQGPRPVLDIVAGATAELRLPLRPEGALVGWIADAPGPVAAGTRLLPSEQVRVRRIVLEGAGLRRELQPRPGARLDEALDRMIDGQDDATAAQFAFVRLPPGDYTLTLEAEGRATHRSQHRVVAGRAELLAPLLLLPLPTGR